MKAIVYPDGRLIWRERSLRCAIGKAGARIDKSEGDGTTPVGVLPIRRVLYRADRMPPPRCAGLVEPIAADDGWCDEPTHRDYNRQIRLPHQARHEELWCRDERYDIVAVLGWNDSPVVKGRGSAIFLHLARPDFAPTDGCIAVASPDLVRLLAEGLTSLQVVLN